MPLTPTHFRRVNRYDDSGGSLHHQVAEAIRAAIADGALSPGEALPGEHAMADMAGVTRGTVRDGVDTLVTEGLLAKRAGRPTRVVFPPQVRHVSTDRYAAALSKIRDHGGQHPASSAFTSDHGVPWDAFTVPLPDYAQGPATAEEAERLALVEGVDLVVRRTLHKQLHGVTVQTQVSVLPLDLAAGTAVMDPTRHPWRGGTIAELYSVGLVVTRATEEARVRAPTPAERLTLEMETAGPVIELSRVFYVGARPVEFSRGAVEATRYVLVFDTEIR